MVKHKVTADVRSLADRYFCEQCDRLGLPRPHPIKPIKLARRCAQVVVDRAKMVATRPTGWRSKPCWLARKPREWGWKRS